MNKVILIGRLARDPEVRYTQGQQGDSAIARFTVAVDRRRAAGPDGQREADFISCVAFGKSAEFLQKYFNKGMKICITGRIQTGSYVNKDNQKVYTTDVVAEDIEFVESKGTQSGGQGYAGNAGYQNQGYPQGGYPQNPGYQAQGGYGNAGCQNQGYQQPQQQSYQRPQAEESEVGRGFMNVDGFEDDALPFG